MKRMMMALRLASLLLSRSTKIRCDFIAPQNIVQAPAPKFIYERVSKCSRNEQTGPLSSPKKHDTFSKLKHLFAFNECPPLSALYGVFV